MDPSANLLSRHQAARRAGVTYNTILLWERAGRLHPEAVETSRGERYFIRSEELDEAAAAERHTFDPTLVWHEEELEPAKLDTEPDPHPEEQDVHRGRLSRLLHRG